MIFKKISFPLEGLDLRPKLLLVISEHSGFGSGGEFVLTIFYGGYRYKICVCMTSTR